MQRLRSLCQERDLDAPRRRDQIVTRLARSYRGDIASVLDDLRRPELFEVARQQSNEGKFDFPPRRKQLRANDLRDLLLRCTTHPATAAVGLYSTGRIGNARPLDIHVLRDDAHNARRATVISAYYAPKMLERLLRKSADVRVLLNGLGGRRLDDQIKELQKLERKLEKKNENAEVKLAFSRGIFHPKLYLFETRSGPIAWVGSANATDAALDEPSQNEEVMLRLEPAPPSLLEYAESAWNDTGRSIEDCRPRIDSLPAFFRTGDLYYKPYVANPMTVNPFESLLKKLSDQQREKLAALRSPYVDSRAGIGAFSIRRAYIRLVDGTSDSADGDDDESRSRAIIRPYAVETCYGYWVAGRFVKTVDAKLKKAAKAKKRFIEGLRDWLVTEPGRCKTITAYREYLRAVRETMVNNEVRLKKDDNHLFDSTDRIERRIDVLTENLSRKSWRSRFSHTVVLQRVPEIWDDIIARKAFEESFFESLAEQSCKGKGKRLRSSAASQLLCAVGIRDESTARTIQDKLEECLTDPDWYDRSFAHMTHVSR